MEKKGPVVAQLTPDLPVPPSMLNVQILSINTANCEAACYATELAPQRRSYPEAHTPTHP
jgi:hypothetical protein